VKFRWIELPGDPDGQPSSGYYDVEDGLPLSFDEDGVYLGHGNDEVSIAAVKGITHAKMLEFLNYLARGRVATQRGVVVTNKEIVEFFANDCGPPADKGRRWTDPTAEKDEDAEPALLPLRPDGFNRHIK
jgi:hypothetical protein